MTIKHKISCHVNKMPLFSLEIDDFHGDKMLFEDIIKPFQKCLPVTRGNVISFAPIHAKGKSYKKSKEGF